MSRTAQSSPATLSAAQVRQQFIEYFAEAPRAHTFVPSSPVVPHDDPTLLFTNAGMNQFKPIFLGQETRGYTRAVNSQKCIRAGGKHNDLEDVGKDTYHHTFFEMLGNWSFGNSGGYFKAEAIEWAWDLLTRVWGIEKERLHATYFEGDAGEGLDPDVEARELWLRYLPPERVHPGNKKDNFWEMGDTGPCGPCSEIHYDSTPGKTGGALVNAGDPSVIEIWNLVFIQFNRAPGSGGKPGKLSPLPAKHVDTGMGFERILRVLQGKTSNYDTDLWTPIFKAIESHTGARPYRGCSDSVVRASRSDESSELHPHGRDARATDAATTEAESDPIDVAYRVIADHIRCLTVAITDGATPSNEGRGYVLRRILRRAVRHAHQTLNTKGAWLHTLVPFVVDSLGGAFPELKENPRRVAQVIRDEEEAFLKTLDRGLELFQHACGFASNGQVRAADAFKLHDTYGFPIDLTRVMAEERGMTVDVEGFEKLMEEARQRSRSGGTEEGEKTIDLPPDAIGKLRHMDVQPTDDSAKYERKPITARVEAIWNGTDFDETTHVGDRVAIILNRTNHYAESGGQVGDRGEITEDSIPGNVPMRGFAGSPGQDGSLFKVEETRATGGFVLHIGHLADGKLSVGDHVVVKVNPHHRQPTQANHTATHLLNFALREVLGEGVQQKGSLVAPDRLRFDFSHHQAMTHHEIEEVQRIVSEQIEEALEVDAAPAPLEKAKQIRGVRAVFGEKYPDPVRVVSIGAKVSALLADPANEKWLECSVEFCGGTHLQKTDEAQRFVVLHEAALASGVRRIVALTGVAAQAANVAGMELLERVEAAGQLDDDHLPGEVDEIAKLLDELTLGTIIRHRVQEALETLRDTAKEIRKRAQKAGREVAVQQAREIAEKHDTTVIVAEVNAGDRDVLLSALDAVRDRRPGSSVMLLTQDVTGEKVIIVSAVPEELIKRGLKAGDWVRVAAQACDGSGGGKPDRAQAGGKNPAKIPDAIEAAIHFAQEKIG
jgi:alanyl-tRNA synthetase